MKTYIGLLLIALILAGVAGYLRATFGHKPDRPGSKPIDPSGGFASPRELRERLSAEAVRRQGTQVRPGLPQAQMTEAPKRKGLLGGRR